MFDDIRDNLNKVTGELIESFVNFDKWKVLHFQAGLYALHSAQQGIEEARKIDLYAVCDTDMLTKLLEENGISKDVFNKIPSVIKDFESGKVDAYNTMKKLPHLLQDAVEKVNAKARSFYEIPASGMIAVTLNLVNPEVKNALIAGQAGERSLKAIERASKVRRASRVASKDSILTGRLYDLGSTSRLALSYIGQFDSDPKYLTAAKATNHLAELLEGAVMLEPAIASYNDIQKSMDVFKQRSVGILSEASKKLNEFGETDASDKIGKLANYLAKECQPAVSDKAALDVIKKGFDSANTALRNGRIFDQKESEDFKTLVGKRLGQIV